MLRKFTLFVDRSVVGIGSNRTGPAYMRASDLVGAMCRSAAVYEGMPIKDRLIDHVPLATDTRRIRSAFRTAYRVECVLSTFEQTHFTVTLKFYKRGEKKPFETIVFYICIADGGTTVRKFECDEC